MRDVGRETGIYGRLDGQHALVALAARQDCVFSLAQLLVLGLSASAVHKRASAGRLHRVHRGVYSIVPPALLSRNGRFMAAVLACGQGAALSHRSAAALHELRRTERAAVDVTVAGRSGRALPGIDIHRSKTLTRADTTLVRGICCTTIARTQLDLGEVLDDRGLERVYDQAEILEVFDLRALEDQLQRNRHSHAARKVRAILQRHRAGATVTWSEFEERFLALVRAAELPQPEVNVWVVPADNEPALRVDFLWREQRLIVETDGHATHRTRRAFETDRRRDQRLTLARWRVVRVTWRQMTNEPAITTRLIAGLLSA